MTRAAGVRAQAKINLMLRVGSSDATGYHAIETVFHRIELSDAVRVRAGGATRSLRVSGPALPRDGLGPEERNLAFRAAVLYTELTGWPSGFAIDLEKNIPAGGGLGGGSADAAAVLRILDALAPEPPGPEAMAGMASQLGADVAFLASDHVAAIGTGRGDILEGIPPLPQREVALVVPSFPVSTAEAYRWLDASRPEEGAAPAPDAAYWLVPAGGFSRWETYLPRAEGLSLGNDFESVVERRHPELTRYRRILGEAGAFLSRMSGSGSTVFGVFPGPLPDLSALRNEVQVLETRTSTHVVPVRAEE